MSDPIQMVNPTKVDWHKYAPMLKEVVSQNHYYTLASVRSEVEREAMQLWDLNGTAAAVTQILNYPKGRFLLVLLVGGKGLKDWKDDFEQEMLKFGRHFKCKKILIGGRKGWNRIYPAWSRQETIMARDI